MDIAEKIEKLKRIYEEFEEKVREFKKEAVCQKGCADCCKQMATIDCTTLEAFVIYNKINAFADPLKSQTKKKLKKEIHKRTTKSHTTCPFLTKEDSCLIYEARPFSCRWVYSLKKCNGKSPTIHRVVFEEAKSTIRKIQQLDNTGYSGHITFILQLFEKESFTEIYLTGGFNPQKLQKILSLYHILPNLKKV
ncbi:hypothetical protein BLFGPEAP_00964 [Candidatus Methanoperedenaceae archaeon GB50]|nr:hypothetical protein BLFGPEAP_00964 [Candidatus Methanoperedenaceae archaeon GB50]CAD7774966.1 hypothetical protein DMNBHIDG_01033 [Candidatus Methanoperedenaceae archaeon GB37]CAD7775459.1 MAG: hypothetical protein KCCBMMGE_00309 [Candidatus Methanoperedenaceae archaeon GB37]